MKSRSNVWVNTDLDPHVHTHFRPYQIAQKLLSHRRKMRKSTNTHWKAGSFAFIAHNRVCASLVYFGVCHLWFPPCVSRLKGVSAASPTQTETERAVINSISQAAVRANEAKTNPFLLMGHMHFYKRLLLFSIFSIIKKPSRTCIVKVRANILASF